MRAKCLASFAIYHANESSVKQPPSFSPSLFPGNDLLVGGKGRDHLFGDSGADTLLGNGGVRNYMTLTFFRRKSRCAFVADGIRCYC